MKADDIRATAVRIQRELMDAGRLVEGGWQSFRLMAIDPRAPQEQLDSMRDAFFAGAQHVFASIMGSLEDGKEATPRDLERLDNLDNELRAFIAHVRLRAAFQGAGGR